MKIAVDIDDTLNIIDRVGKAGAYIERKGLDFHLEKEFSNKFVEVYDWGADDVLEFIREGGIVAFTDAEARRGAKEALTRWRKEGHKVIILTSREETWFTNPEKVAHDWLEKRHIPYDEIVAAVPSQEKGKYCLEHDIPILIDDDPDACIPAQELGVRAVLAVGRHNIHRAKEVRYGGANWRQLDAAVHHILSLIK